MEYFHLIMAGFCAYGIVDAMALGDSYQKKVVTLLVFFTTQVPVLDLVALVLALILVHDWVFKTQALEDDINPLIKRYMFREKI